MGILPITIISFLFGTLWGSFFYTLAIRYTDGSMAAKPLEGLFSRSRCPACRNEISPIMLIPIFGYIWSGNAEIAADDPGLYPAMEILEGHGCPVRMEYRRLIYGQHLQLQYRLCRPSTWKPYHSDSLSAGTAISLPCYIKHKHQKVCWNACAFQWFGPAPASRSF